KRLQENIALNNLPQITTFTCALSDHDGCASFSIARGAGENTLADSFAYTDTGLTERVTVQLRTLDNIAKEQALKHLRLIKIDVEGAELHVLRGAKNILTELRPAVLFEVFPAALLRMQTTVADMDAFLRAANYTLYTIDTQTAQWQTIANLHGIHHCTNILALPHQA
ncbi:MAG: FkbM family methyltransferase, partial [Alphaproteobacteria bacterium]|nr:FkbM family methyltransferase [Alphaproteobacteria bacterium]